jgi:hypothetical protein
MPVYMNHVHWIINFLLCWLLPSLHELLLFTLFHKMIIYVQLIFLHRMNHQHQRQQLRIAMAWLRNYGHFGEFLQKRRIRISCDVLSDYPVENSEELFLQAMSMLGQLSEEREG